MKTKIQIKSVLGTILFEHEREDNSMCKTLMEAIKSGATLSWANLSWADLRGTDLRGTDLSWADLRGTDLSGADLSGADANENTTMYFPQCPDGAFVGWKKANKMIVKLLIPESAKRSSATSLKCRCSEAKVLEIQNLDGSDSKLKAVSSDRDSSFIYTIGETVKVDDFDENRWNECSTGIHFFISREAAVLYR